MYIVSKILLSIFLIFNRRNIQEVRYYVTGFKMISQKVVSYFCEIVSNFKIIAFVIGIGESKKKKLLALSSHLSVVQLYSRTTWSDIQQKTRHITKTEQALRVTYYSHLKFSLFLPYALKGFQKRTFKSTIKRSLLQRYFILMEFI